MKIVTPNTIVIGRQYLVLVFLSQYNIFDKN